MASFSALLTSLPTGNSTLRMRVWRALKNTGCGVLRDGVYLLPAGSPRTEALVEAETEIKSAGGFAMTVELNFKTATQLDYVRKLFDRSHEYGALVAKISAAKAALPRLGKRKADTLVQRVAHTRLRYFAGSSRRNFLFAECGSPPENSASISRSSADIASLACN